MVHGTLARIGPKHLMTSDPALIRRILAARSRYSRGPSFDAFRIDPHIPNIFAERDETKHNRLKYKLAAGVRKVARPLIGMKLTRENKFTSRHMGFLEPMIDERLLDWLQRAHRSWTSDSRKYIAFDIGKRIQFLTVDIITQICLGKELGCVSIDSDKYDFLAIVERGYAVSQHFSVLLEWNSFVYYLTKIPIISDMIIPRPGEKSGVSRIMGVSTPLADLQGWEEGVLNVLQLHYKTCREPSPIRHLLLPFESIAEHSHVQGCVGSHVSQL